MNSVLRRLRRAFNHYLAETEMALGRNRLWSYPSELCIDVSNKCNLRCPYCPTGRGEQGGRGRGSISVDLFRNILDDLAPYAYQLELFNWGEPFFNRELPTLIRDASVRGLRTVISSNLSFPLSDDQVRAVVDSGLSHLAAAVDGVDQQSYEVYRRGGSFDLVMQNLRAFVRAKRELGVSNPYITWQYLVFAHNEGRVEEARRLSAELGLDNFFAMGGLYDDPSWAPKGEYNFNYLKVGEKRCSFLWKKAVFHFDGGLASCCMGFNKHDDFDDFRPGQFRRMWNNEKFVAARRIWTAPLSPLPDGHFCVSCDKVKLFRGLPLTSKMRRPADAEDVPRAVAAAR
ncbi:MAG: radical SAM protein [Deltaproteobacteria bacterium]|nr:radical SAM protein [Deltaproteobacteria bacterium]